MINELRTKYPRIYNTWRSIRFTKKGKKIGHSEEWNDFITFFNDVKDSYSKGKVDNLATDAELSTVISKVNTLLSNLRSIGVLTL